MSLLCRCTLLPFSDSNNGHDGYNSFAAKIRLLIILAICKYTTLTLTASLQPCEQIAAADALFSLQIWTLGLYFSATDVKQREAAFAVKCHSSFIFISIIFARSGFNQ